MRFSIVFASNIRGPDIFVVVSMPAAIPGLRMIPLRGSSCTPSRMGELSIVKAKMNILSRLQSLRVLSGNATELAPGDKEIQRGTVYVGIKRRITVTGVVKILYV